MPPLRCRSTEISDALTHETKASGCSAKTGPGCIALSSSLDNCWRILDSKFKSPSDESSGTRSPLCDSARKPLDDLALGDAVCDIRERFARRTTESITARSAQLSHPSRSATTMTARLRLSIIGWLHFILFVERVFQDLLICNSNGFFQKSDAGANHPGLERLVRKPIAHHPEQSVQSHLRNRPHTSYQGSEYEISQ